ncbi:hypothetical protein STEG23_017207 [Scotinomys teguina]
MVRQEKVRWDILTRERGRRKTEQGEETLPPEEADVKNRVRFIPLALIFLKFLELISWNIILQTTVVIVIVIIIIIVIVIIIVIIIIIIIITIVIITSTIDI